MNKALVEEAEKYISGKQEPINKYDLAAFTEAHIEKMKCCANCMYEPPFDKHCDNCIRDAINLRYRNWKLREIKEKCLVKTIK